MDAGKRSALRGPQRHSHLAALVALVDAGVVRSTSPASRPLTDLTAVHRNAEFGRTRGKTIPIT
jgi:hypothetical protein